MNILGVVCCDYCLVCLSIVLKSINHCVIHSIDYRPWCASLTHTLGFRIVQLSVVVAYSCDCSIEHCLKPCLSISVVRLTA